MAKYYNSSLKMLAAGIAQMGLALLFLGVGIYLVFFDTLSNRTAGIVGGLVLLPFAIIPFFLSIYSFMHLKPSARLSIAIDNGGLLVADRDEILHWKDISRIVLVCWRQPGGASTIAPKIIKFGTNHVHIETKPNGQAYSVAFDDELAGGYRSFVEVSRLLIEQGRSHGIPVKLLESGRPWVHADLGNPETIKIEDLATTNANN